VGQVLLDVLRPVGADGEDDLGDVGQEHQPQDVVVLDVAGGQRGGALAIEQTWKGECEGDEKTEHVQLQYGGIARVCLQ